MGTTDWTRRSSGTGFVLAVVALVASVVFGVAPALADGVQVNEQPVDGWETDGTVYAVKIVGSTVYIGGEFANVRSPAGSTLTRSNLAAIDMPTGDITGFRADTNGVVRAIEANGGDLWIGGTFTSVEGLTRNRLAVIDIATSTVRTDITPAATGAVNDLRLSGSHMYVGGTFGKIDGTTRQRIARLTAADGSLDGAWNPGANAAVDAVAIPSAGDVIYVSGNFTEIAGQSRSYVAGISPSTGAVVTPQFENLTYRAIALDVTPAGDRVMAGLGGLGNRLAVWNPTTGAQAWRIYVGGNLQAVKYHQGNVYFGFHDHYQGNSHVKVLSADAYTGSLEPWRPGIPTFWGVWAIDASASQGLAVGGQFTKVEGIKTRNVAIFHPLAQSDSSPPSTPQNVTVTLTTETQISLGWDASTDNVGVTAYTVWRDGVPEGVTVDTFFNDKGNLPGAEFTYVITAGDNAANESAPTPPLVTSTLNGLIPIGSEWAYLDDGSDQGTAWRQVGFDDSGWSRSDAELGFGDGGEATVLAPGAITYYFRRDLVLSGDPLDDLMMAVQRDDGVVVYVNGVEVWRDNMPGGTITASTRASSTVAGSDEEVFPETTVPASMFQAGVNEIAVEVHQVSPGSSDISFDLALWGDVPADVDPPSTPTGMTVVDVTESTVSLSWNASTDNTAVAGYSIRRDGGIVGTSGNTTFTDVGLDPDATYSYTVQAFDGAGNRSGQSSPPVEATTDGPDVTPPSVPTGLQVTSVTETSVSLTWAPSTDDTAVTNYIVRRNGGVVGNVAAPGFVDTGLTPNTTYDYTVEAEDAAGNTSGESGETSGTTDPDTTPPSSPAPLTVVGTTASSVSLSWGTSTDNVSLAGYSVRRDGAPVTTTNGTSYTDIGLAPSTTFQYEVVAIDAAGNESDPAGPRSATTADLNAGELIPAGSVWRYRDNGSNQGTGWRSATFNDSSWPAGSAEFGFGDGDETSLIQEGFVTYYFRRSFEPQGGVTGGATLNVLRDDGVVVYINGTEVFRNNMPGGTIDYLTRASTTIAGSAETTWLEASVPASVFKTGANVIAVEIHQVSAGSSDVSFDLSLDADTQLLCDGEIVTMPGTSGDDVIVGTPERDVIHGLGGDDVIEGLGGNDVLCGGGGADRLVGGGGNDVLIGGSGRDVLLGKNGRDRLDGNKGRDRLDGGRGHDTLRGGSGIDEASFAGMSAAVDADLSAGTSTGQGTDSMTNIEHLRGSGKADTLRGDAGPNRLMGGGGGDDLFGRGGRDVLLGQSGSDELSGGGGNDRLDGGSGFDTLRGGSGTDTCSNGEVISGC